MKIAIFGGAFDPVHNGHIENVRFVLDTRKPEKVVLIPAYISPFKQDRKSAEAHHRLRMLKLAFQHMNDVEISEYELLKEGISYTIDTLRYYAANYSDIELVIGYDNLLVFEKWREPDEIIRLCRLVVLRRISDGNMKENKYFKKAVFLNSPMIDISSSGIRERLANNMPVEGMIPPAVLKYIKQKKLYLP